MSVQLVDDVLGVTPAGLIPSIERKVYGNQRGQLNRLNDAGGISASDGTLTFEFDAGGIRPGAYLEIDDEVLFVWSVSAQVATVERGMLGTTAATHADNAVIRVEPRFFRAEMADEVGVEIRSWPTNIYARYAGELTVGAAARAVDVSGLSGLGNVALLRAIVEGDVDSRWPVLATARVERRQSYTDFPSGYALTLGSVLGVAKTVRLVLRAPFDTSGLTASTDLGLLGLTRDLTDIIPWGVAARMLMSRDVARTDANAQGRSRPAEEVRTGEMTQVGRALLAERDRLLNEAANRLLAEDGMGWS